MGQRTVQVADRRTPRFQGERRLDALEPHEPDLQASRVLGQLSPNMKAFVDVVLDHSHTSEGVELELPEFHQPDRDACAPVDARVPPRAPCQVTLLVVGAGVGRFPIPSDREVRLEADPVLVEVEGDESSPDAVYVKQTPFFALVADQGPEGTVPLDELEGWLGFRYGDGRRRLHLGRWLQLLTELVPQGLEVLQGNPGRSGGLDHGRHDRRLTPDDAVGLHTEDPGRILAEDRGAGRAHVLAAPVRRGDISCPTVVQRYLAQDATCNLRGSSLDERDSPLRAVMFRPHEVPPARYRSGRRVIPIIAQPQGRGAGCSPSHILRHHGPLHPFGRGVYPGHGDRGRGSRRRGLHNGQWPDQRRDGFGDGGSCHGRKVGRRNDGPPNSHRLLRRDVHNPLVPVNGERDGQEPVRPGDAPHRIHLFIVDDERTTAGVGPARGDQIPGLQVGVVGHLAPFIHHEPVDLPRELLPLLTVHAVDRDFHGTHAGDLLAERLTQEKEEEKEINVCEHVNSLNPFTRIRFDFVFFTSQIVNWCADPRKDHITRLRLELEASQLLHSLLGGKIVISFSHQVGEGRIYVKWSCIVIGSVAEAKTEVSSRLGKRVGSSTEYAG